MELRSKYNMSSEVEARFKHYSPRGQFEIETHENIRLLCKTTAKELINLLPLEVINSREFSQVLTDLENAMMHANAAYARYKPNTV